ncbi:hypothetical protein [Lysobacter sp. CA196]|uniref:hypothetical protein n=1 Tax=Lysobacter sp. CA196 TaxID=3455606 RepID=UPI003F8D1DDC
MEKISSTADAPRRRKTPGANGFRYRPKYGVIVVCRDEAHQQRLYAELKAQGLKLRVVCV